FEPQIEGVGEDALALTVRQRLEARIHACVHGALPQQLRAKAVDRADACFLQALQRILERAVSLAAALFGAPRILDPGAEPEIQLAGGLLGERDRHEALDLRTPRSQCR